MERKFDKKEYGKQDRATGDRKRSSSGGAKGENGRSDFANKDKSKSFGDKGKTSRGGKFGGDRPDRKSADWKKTDSEKPVRDNSGLKKAKGEKIVRINPDWKKISKESPDGKNISSFVSKKELKKKQLAELADK